MVFCCLHQPFFSFFRFVIPSRPGLIYGYNDRLLKVVDLEKGRSTQEFSKLGNFISKVADDPHYKRVSLQPKKKKKQSSTKPRARRGSQRCLKDPQNHS